ncbi:MAG: cell division protease FtsH [Planctomycetota bacterium]|jgi:cell division protease FtsH
MADSKESPDGKPQKTRSFGSFMLFIFILIAVLAIFGSETIQNEKALSQDQYLWSLYTGRVHTQTIKGTPEGSNLITGTHVSPETGKQEGFKVQFANVELFERVYQQLKAVREVHPINALNLKSALEGQWYVPQDARLITAFTERAAEISRPSEAGDDSTPPTIAPATIDRRENLIVRVLSKSKSAYLDQNMGSTHPPFPLDDRSGMIWLDVDVRDVSDLSGLLASIEGFGVPVDNLTLDLTPTKGSYWGPVNGTFSTILMYIGPWILIFVVFMLFMRQMRNQGGAGGVMSFGRSRAQLYQKDNNTGTTFDDVAGMQEAKDEVRELVEFLKNPGRFARIGGRIPRGVLLVGAPGCGKTLLAKAIAGEAEVPFFSISGSDFVEMFVGVGASRVRDLFKQARESSPCIIFLDEIDAVGRRRGSGMGGGHDEREQTLNAILVEMDGFGTDKGIIVVAATNRPDVLDPALLRPGRFDREVAIEMPDYEGRLAILEVHLKRVKSDKTIELPALARSAPGYSGADLAAIVNEAAIMAVLDKCEEVKMEHLEEARDKVRYGRKRTSAKIEEEDLKITAVHEAGHAVVAALLPGVDSPHKITIIPRGRALGSTMTLPDKESYHTQKKRLLGQLVMLFGGRVAEAEFCGDISAGASDDIKRATALARTMITELGMSDTIGPINYGERQGSDFLGTELMRGKDHSDEIARQIDEEVRAVINHAYEEATTLLRANHEAVENLTAALLRYETINGEEVKMLLDGVSVEDLRPKEPEPEVSEGESVEQASDPNEGREAADDRTGEMPGNAGLSPA